jgi:copper transport protein
MQDERTAHDRSRAPARIEATAREQVRVRGARAPDSKPGMSGSCPFALAVPPAVLTQREAAAVRSGRWLVVTTFVIMWTFVAAAPASAHAGFVTSTPEPGQSLGIAPGVVELSFSEPLNTDLSRATVTIPGGEPIEGEVVDDRTISIVLTTQARGRYDVSWATVSTVDGHALTGSFSFGVGVTVGRAGGGETRTSPGAAELVIALGRMLEDAALLAAVGVMLLGRLASTDPPLDWVRAAPRAPLGLAVAAGSIVVLGEALVASPSTSVAEVFTYLTTGTAGLARLARPLLELTAFILASRRVRAAATFGAIVALAAAGHAAAVGPRWWGVAVQAVHLISVATWAGGILALALQRPPGGWRSTAGRELLGRFTPVALVAFGLTAITGVLRGLQEIGPLSELLRSSYGAVLLVKLMLVVLMLQLSLLAWRRIIVHPRVEAAVAVAVIGAAALLASYPLPPARVVEAEEGPTGVRASALPRPGDLTLGSHAGEFLVGLTIRPQTDALLIFLRGLDGDAETATRAVEVMVDEEALDVTQCADTCRKAETALAGGESIEVIVEGVGGGTARFGVPELSAASGEELLASMDGRMSGLSSYRLDETLSSGRARIRTRYRFLAPDSFSSRSVLDQGGSQVIWIGQTRYMRALPDGPWDMESGSAPSVPAFVWESFEPFVDTRIIGRETVDDVRTEIVSFFGGDAQLPAWFRLWIDTEGLVRRAEMRAQGHFMDHRYYAFDAADFIHPPKEVVAETDQDG